MGSLSLLQWIFPTQESNWGLLHCILYQLSHQGNPDELLKGRPILCLLWAASLAFSKCLRKHLSSEKSSFLLAWELLRGKTCLYHQDDWGSTGLIECPQILGQLNFSDAATREVINSVFILKPVPPVKRRTPSLSWLPTVFGFQRWKAISHK